MAIFKQGILARIGKDGLEWTDTKLLKGAGTGVDPTEIDVPTFDCTVEAEGSYAGGDTVNRAIAHGLGIVPRAVRLWSNDVTIDLFINPGRGIIMCHQSGTEQGEYAVTAPDDTNFYVGNATSYVLSGNGSGTTYRWLAWG